jgi:hypothetical protein
VSQREASVTWGGGHGWLASLCTLRAQCCPPHLPLSSSEVVQRLRTGPVAASCPGSWDLDDLCELYSL